MNQTNAGRRSLLQTLSDSASTKDLALSTDGKLIGSSAGRVWDTETGALLRTFDPLVEGYRAAFSVNAQVFMSISRPGHVKVWDMATGLLLRSWRSAQVHPTWGTGKPKHLFSPDRSFAVIAFETLTFEVIDLENGESLRIIDGPKRQL
jgi:WD40 repeat protein